MKKRSIGVMIFGSFNRIFFGFFGLLLSIFGFVMSFGEQATKIVSKIGLPTGIRLYTIYMIIISAALMITGDGVLKLRESARIDTIYVGIAMLVFNILINIKYIFSFWFWLSLIYPVLLIYFFTRPKVKEQFSPERGEENSR